MKTLYLLFILSMLPFLSFGQQQAFVKYLKTDKGPLTAEDVIVSDDHVYAVFGIQKTRGLETSLVIKMDSIGELIWSKELGDDVIMRNQKLYLTNDGNIICVGESFDLDFGNTDIFWVEFDPNGDIVEQKAIGSNEYENVYDISFNEDGDVVITGAISDNNGEYDLFVQRISAAGMLSEGAAFDIGTFNYPFDIKEVEGEYVISMRYTDRQSATNKGAVLWLDSLFTIQNALEFSFPDNQVFAQEVLYDTEEALYYVFIQSSIATGFILLNDQLDNVGSHSFFADDFDHSYLINGRKYLSTNSGQFFEIEYDSLSSMGYWLQAEETGVNALDYHDETHSLYGVGAYRSENSGMITKSFVGRNMSCGSYSFETSNEGPLPIMDINLNVISSPLDLQIVDHTYSWRDILLEEGDSCLVSCQRPNADFSIMEEELTVELNVTDPEPDTDYEWRFSNGDQAFGSSVSYTFSMEGTYELCLFAYNACGDDSTCMEVDLVVSGVADEAAQMISVYPNPADDELYFTQGVYNNASAINLQGRSFPLRVDGNSVDLEGLASGMYILKLEDQKGKYSFARFIRL